MVAVDAKVAEAAQQALATAAAVAAAAGRTSPPGLVGPGMGVS
jgi:hypothetical protein